MESGRAHPPREKFSGLDELAAQIAMDASAARALLAGAPPGDDAFDLRP